MSDLGAIPVELTLPDGRVFRVDDIVSESEVDRNDLSGESSRVGGRIARYGWLFAFYSTRVAQFERAKKEFRSEFVAKIKRDNKLSIMVDGQLWEKAKPTEKDVDAACRLQPEYQSIMASIEQESWAKELFRGLYYAQRAKDQQLSNLMRGRGDKE
jgi:hypothetical protein